MRLFLRSHMRKCFGVNALLCGWIRSCFRFICETLCLLFDFVVINANTIRQRQKNWLGHALRSESFPRTVLEGRMEKTRTRGRQSATRLGEKQRRGIWSYKEKSLWQRRLASLEAWTCLKRQRTLKSRIETLSVICLAFECMVTRGLKEATTAFNDKWLTANQQLYFTFYTWRRDAR